MNNVVGLTIFAVGIVLLIFGFSASQSLGSEISRLFTGHPTDRSLWLVVGGVGAVVAGLLLAVRGIDRS